MRRRAPYQVRSRKERRSRTPADLDARRKAAKTKDAEILAILDRSTELARTLRDRLHYDKEMDRVHGQMTATLERLKETMAAAKAARADVLGEQIGLHSDISILQNELDRRAGRPTLAEHAVRDLAYLKDLGFDPAPLVTMLDLMPTKPSALPTEAALSRYDHALEAWKEQLVLLLALSGDVVEIMRFRESIAVVPAGTAEDASSGFRKNYEPISQGLDEYRTALAQLKSDRANLLSRRALLELSE